MKLLGLIRCISSLLDDLQPFISRVCLQTDGYITYVKFDKLTTAFVLKSKHKI